METFTDLWFTPLSTSDPAKLAARIEKRTRNLCETVVHVRNRVAGVVEDFMKSVGFGRMGENGTFRHLNLRCFSHPFP